MLRLSHYPGKFARRWRPKQFTVSSYYPSFGGRLSWLSSRRRLTTSSSGGSGTSSSTPPTKKTMTTRRNQHEQEGLTIPRNEIPTALSFMQNYDEDDEQEIITSIYNIKRRGEEGGRRKTNNNKKKYYNKEEAERELKLSKEYLQAIKLRHEELVNTIALGEYTKQDWKDGRNLMEYYCQLGKRRRGRRIGQQQQQQSQQPAIPHNDLPQTILLSLELLERLLQEIQQQQQQQQQQQSSSPLEEEDQEEETNCNNDNDVILFSLESDWLKTITETWREAYQKLATRRRRDSINSMIIEPKELLEKLIHLSDHCSNGLLTLHSKKIYLALMDVSLRLLIKQQQQHKNFNNRHKQITGGGGGGDFSTTTTTTRKMRETAEFIESLLHLGIERTPPNNNNHNTLGKDPKAYQIVLNAWESCCDGPRAHTILQRMCEIYDNYNNDHVRTQQQQQHHHYDSTNILLHREAFESVLKAYAKGPKIPSQKTITECRQVLDRMKYYHTQHGLDTMPKNLAYNTLLTCLLHGTHTTHTTTPTTTTTRAITEEAEKLFYDEIPKQYRDRTTYNILLEMYSNYAMDDKAARLLNEMIEASTNKNNNNNTVEDDVVVAGSSSSHQNDNDDDDDEEQQQLLERQKNQASSISSSLVSPPNVKSFNLLLQASNKAENYGAVEQTIRMMEELQAKKVLNNVAPDKFSYSILLDSWSKQVGRVPDACDRVDAIFHTMKRLAKEGNRSMTPSTVTYTTVMNAFAKAGNATRTEELLGEMMDEYLVRGNRNVRPDRTTFNTVLLALSRSDQQDAVSKIEGLMQQMEEMSTNGTLGQQDLRPDIRSHNSLLQARARSGQRDAGEQCERIMLERMSPNQRLQPNSFTYLIVVQAYAKAGKAEQAERILEHVCDEYYKNHHHHNNKRRNANKPTIQIYSAVMNAWSKRRTEDSPERAEVLLQRMKEQSAAGDLSGTIDRTVYNTLLDTWANSGREEAGERTEEILQEMESSGITPNTITYNVAMKTWSMLGNPDRCQNLFDRMRELPGIQPGHETLCTLLTAFSRSDFDRTEERAEVVLKKLNELQVMSGITANVACYNVVLDCLSKSNKEESGRVAEDLLYEMERLSRQASGGDGRNALAVRPDAVSYACVMDAFANTGDAEKAEMLLERLIKEYVRTNDSRLRPTVLSFNIALKAYAQKCKKLRSPEAPERAEALFDRMQSLHRTAGVPVKPDVTSMNILMDVWGHSAIRRSSDRVLAILQSMLQSEDADITPTTISYNTALHAFALSGECEIAEGLLKSMYTAYNEKVALHDHLVAKPNLISWNLLLSAYAKSKLPGTDTAERAADAIEKMDELFATGTLDARPNTHSFNCLMNCLAMSSRSDAGASCKAVIEKMQSRFESGDESVKPDARSFGAGIKAWLKCSDLEAALMLLDKMCVAYEKGDDGMKPNMKTFQKLLEGAARHPDSTAPEQIRERAKQFYPQLLDGTEPSSRDGFESNFS